MTSPSWRTTSRKRSGASPFGRPALSQRPSSLPIAKVFSNAPRYSGSSSLNVILLDALNAEFLSRTYARDELLKYLGSGPAIQPTAVYALENTLKLLHDFTTDAERAASCGGELQAAGAHARGRRVFSGNAVWAARRLHHHFAQPGSDCERAGSAGPGPGWLSRTQEPDLAFRRFPARLLSGKLRECGESHQYWWTATADAPLHDSRLPITTCSARCAASATR